MSIRRLLLILAGWFVLAAPTGAPAQDLGHLSANPYGSDSTANPHSPAGSPYSATSVRNPHGAYGSPYSNQSATNPYATEAPKLYDQDGNYRGRLSTNPYDPESTSNPYGRYGSKYSPDSINNPYGAGNPYRNDSPSNPYGVGMKIVAGEGDEVPVRAAKPAASEYVPMFAPRQATEVEGFDAGETGDDSDEEWGEP